MYDADVKIWNFADTQGGEGREGKNKRREYHCKSVRLEGEWNFWETERRVKLEQRDETGKARGHKDKTF